MTLGRFLYFYYMKEFTFFRKNDYIWITADRIEIPLSEMSVNHILNAISCLYDRGSRRIPDIYLGKTKAEWIKIFTSELSKRNVIIQ